MKKLFVLVVLVFTGAVSFPQSFMHGAGIGFFVNTKDNGKASLNAILTYSPRFNFIEKENLSVSVGLPLSVGFSGSYSATYSSYYGSSTNNTLGVMVNMPLMVNLNMGAGSSKEIKKKIGYFAGAGFGYHYATFKENFLDIYGDEYENAEKIGSFGPAANAGVRFAVGRKTRNIEIRFSYMKGIDENKANIIGVATLFNF